jgi:alkylated DNA nucleotide flippase Atl1
LDWSGDRPDHAELTVSDFDFERAIPFVEAIPSGRWTGYKDVAAAAGNPSAFHSAGNHMRDSGGRIHNYWRVIHSDGSVPKNFIAPADAGPNDQYAAKQRLVKEGVRFNARGFADPRQHFSYEQWARAGRRPAADEAVAVAERDEKIVAEVNQRRIAKGQAPLTGVQKAEMLSRLAAERTAASG